jgi:hypothetical protein
MVRRDGTGLLCITLIVVSLFPLAIAMNIPRRYHPPQIQALPNFPSSSQSDQPSKKLDAGVDNSYRRSTAVAAAKGMLSKVDHTPTAYRMQMANRMTDIPNADGASRQARLRAIPPEGVDIRGLVEFFAASRTASAPGRTGLLMRRMRVTRQGRTGTRPGNAKPGNAAAGNVRPKDARSATPGRRLPADGTDGARTSRTDRPPPDSGGTTSTAARLFALPAVQLPESVSRTIIGAVLETTRTEHLRRVSGIGKTHAIAWSRDESGGSPPQEEGDLTSQGTDTPRPDDINLRAPRRQDGESSGSNVQANRGGAAGRGTEGAQVYDPRIVPDPDRLELLMEILGPAAAEPWFEGILNGAVPGRDALLWLSDRSRKKLLFHGSDTTIDGLERRQPKWMLPLEWFSEDFLNAHPEVRELARRYPDGFPHGLRTICAAQNPDIAIFKAMEAQLKKDDAERRYGMLYYAIERDEEPPYIEGHIKFEVTGNTLERLLGHGQAPLSGWVHVVDGSQFKLYSAPPAMWPSEVERPGMTPDLRTYQNSVLPLLRVRVTSADLFALGQRNGIYPAEVENAPPYDLSKFKR